MKTFVIVNPTAGNGASMKRWPRLCEKLEKAIGKFDYDFTNAEGVATLLSNSAVKEGYKKIIAVGGDGTLHEVLQGLFEDGGLIDPDIILGTLPFGTGVDMARFMGIPNDMDEAVIKMRGDKCKKIDVGVAQLTDHNGRERVSYFVGMADVGLGGYVAERANNSTKILGGFATYLFSSLLSFASYKAKKVHIVADSEDFEEEVTSIFVANARYFGGGMHLAPRAEVDDGLFDVVMMKKLPKWEVVSIVPHLYSGKILSHPRVKYFRTSRLSVESEEKILINLDGEQPGTTPVHFKLLHKVLNFKI